MLNTMKKTLWMQPEFQYKDIEFSDFSNSLIFEQNCSRWFSKSDKSRKLVKKEFCHSIGFFTSSENEQEELSRQWASGYISRIASNFKNGLLPYQALKAISKKFNVCSSTVDCIWSRANLVSTDWTLSADVSSTNNNCGRKSINVSENQDRLQDVHISNRTTMPRLGTLRVITKQLYKEPSQLVIFWNAPMLSIFCFLVYLNWKNCILHCHLSNICLTEQNIY